MAFGLAHPQYGPVLRGLVAGLDVDSAAAVEAEAGA